MKPMSPEAKVGLMVLGGLLILVYMSLRLGQLGLGPRGGYRLVLELDNAVGLVKEGEALVAGIPVGRVEEIRLEDAKALITLRINEDVQLPVDSVASLRTHGVLGEKYLEIQPGSSPRMLTEGDQLRPGVPPGDLDVLVSRLNEISADVKRVTERLANVLGTPEGEENLRDLLVGFRNSATSLNEVIEENRETLRLSLERIGDLSENLLELVDANRENFDQTMANARQLTETLAERAPAIAENLDALTADLRGVVSENRENLRLSLANLREATGQISTTLESLTDLAESMGSPDGTLGRLIRDDSLYTDLQAAVRDFRAVVGRLEKGEGTLGKLLTDDAAYAELTESLRNLRNVSEKIDQGQGTIGKLVNEEEVHDSLNQTLEGVNEFVAGANRLQFEVGYRGELLAKEGALKNYVGVEIRPRQDRFYFVGINDDPVDNDDDMEFSAQLGKRFSFLTLRAGIFESSGGVGADMDFFADRFRLSFEAFDFDRDEGPAHLKLFARYTFLKHLFVTAGLDDFVDDHGRADYIIGGGIRFVDDDFKFLIGPAASAAK